MKFQSIRIRIFAGALAGILLTGSAGLSALAAGNTDGDGNPIASDSTFKTQLGYIGKALDNLRDIGITPDVVLSEVGDLWNHLVGEKLEESDSSSSATSQETSSKEDSETEDAAEDSKEDSTENDFDLKEAADQATEDAESFVSGKVSEAKEQAKETAKDKLTAAITSFLDSLFN